MSQNTNRDTHRSVAIRRVMEATNCRDSTASAYLSRLHFQSEDDIAHAISRITETYPPNSRQN